MGWLLVWLVGLVGMAVGGVSRGLAEIPVEGLADRAVVADRVSFRVPTAAGYRYEIALDGHGVVGDRTYEVTEADYHELIITRTATASGTVEVRRVRFIVRASERGNTEWGLPPWTPPAVIESSAEEFGGATLRLLMPAAFPAGMDIPVAIRVDGSDGQTLRANGWVRSTAHAPIQVRRGVGSGWIPGPTNSGAWTYRANVAGLATERTLRVEGTGSAWTAIVGALPAGSKVWPADARIEVTGDLTIGAGTSLSIEAGTVVRLAAGATIDVLGELAIRGTTERPVVFVPTRAEQPWGGFIVRRGARLTATAGMFVGSGANASWFSQHPGYDVHRKEQALLLVDGGQAEWTDCAAFDGRGQFGHGRDGQLTLERTLVQRFITGGEYSGGKVRVRGSAFVEFPRDDGVFADGDNDGLYFTTGDHVVEDTLIGWTKDDGIDAGTGASGTVSVSNVWVEGNFHEAFAWSGGGRRVTQRHCVAFHCGQGIECGWSTGTNSPLVDAEDCLVIGNAVGLRFGDNYDWTYDGFLRATNSVVLGNRRDVFGRAWDDWTDHVERMDIRGNWLSAPMPQHPHNTPWEAARDGGRLAAFGNVPPNALPGIGWAWRENTGAEQARAGELTLGLSRFVPWPVEVDYAVDARPGGGGRGTVRFEAGETLKRVAIDPSWLAGATVARVGVEAARGAAITGTAARFVAEAPSDSVMWIVRGSEWRYRDTGVDPGDAWPFLGYDDSAWKSGPAELGYGDGDEATVVQGGPSNDRFATTWFRRSIQVSDPRRYGTLEIRLRRDDGAIVYLNGREVFRSNLPSGPVTADTFTGSGTGSETQFFVQRIAADALVTGTNVVAVEVHQSSRSSSDVSFDLELVAFPALRLGWERFGLETVLYWNDSAAVLERAESVTGPWQPVPGVAGTTRSVEASEPGIYRLSRP